MQGNFLFVGLNPNTNVQEKTPEICTFHGWCFKNKKHLKYLNVGTQLFSPSPSQISDYAPGSQTGKRGSCRRDIVSDKEILRHDTLDQTLARDIHAW